ncbi:hypothetical protein [Secundilactobacillus oryzae]|uniref:hypothetical protein n=1 Tax=Secundilactobacillus oryzae TaxID=1202668 RepID=UPI000B2BA5D2|nr:hypothetical protein [Secundilactobacillus oryzae]
MNDRKIIALPDNLKTQLGVTSGSKIEVLTGHGEAQIKVAKEVQSTGWRWLSPILTFLTTVGFVAYFFGAQ